MLHNALRSGLLLVLLSFAVAGASPRAASGQGLGPTVGGAAAGAIAGTALSAGMMTVLARNEVYLWNPADLVGWMGAPIAIGAIGGGLEGAVASDRLGPAVVLSAMGGLAGAGLGYLVGRELFDDGHDGWAGLMIGGSTGVLAGWLYGTIAGGSRTETIPATSMTLLTLPLGAIR